MVDELLYAHYEEQFDVLLAQVADVQRAVTALEAKPKVTVSTSKPTDGIRLSKWAPQLKMN